MAEIHELYLKIENIDIERESFLSKINDNNINAINETERKKTLLHMALERNDTATALALIRKGARCDIIDTDDFTAVDLAALFRNLEVLLALKNHPNSGFDPNRFSDGAPPFYRAVKIGDKDLIEFWLKLGADVHSIITNEITSETDTILKAADKEVSEDYIFNMRLLLKWGIGFKNDFTGVRLFDEITEGCIILNSYQDDKPITRQTPGCQNAYTNLAELKEAINTGKKINIMCKTSVFEQHLSDPDVYNVYKLLNSTSTTLKNKLLFFINDHPEKIKSLEFLPNDLKPEVAASITISSNN